MFWFWKKARIKNFKKKYSNVFKDLSTWLFYWVNKSWEFVNLKFK